MIKIVVITLGVIGILLGLYGLYLIHRLENHYKK